MRRGFFLLILISLLCSLFLCSSCGKNQLPEVVVFRPSSGLYFYGEATTTTPALEGFQFVFPIVTKNPCTQASDLTFFYQGAEIVMDSVNDLELLPIYNTNKDYSNGRIYDLQAMLFKHDMGEQLLIDRIDVVLDGVKVSFEVDISIRYQYMQAAYNSTYWKSNSGEEIPNGVRVQYFILPGYHRGEGKITSITGKIMDMADTVSMRLTDLEGNEYDIWNSPLIGMKYYVLSVDYSGLDPSFVADTLYISFSDEEETVTYCTSEGHLWTSETYGRLNEPHRFLSK